jgi:N-acetylmuramic acid 6-phosphate (MurNAc-6-P) etherase
LEEADGSAKLAIVMQMKGVEKDRASELLEDSNGRLGDALAAR